MWIELCIITELLSYKYKECDKVPICHIKDFKTEQIENVWVGRVVTCKGQDKEKRFKDYCYFSTRDNKGYYTEMSCKELLERINQK